MIFEIKNNKIILTENIKSDNELICIYTSEEFQNKNIYDIPNNQEHIHFCKLEDTKKYMYGTFCIPIKGEYLLSDSFKIYILKSAIIFIDDNNYVNKIIKDIINLKSKNNYNLMKFLHDFLENIIKDDLIYLEAVEKKLAYLEDKVLKNKDSDINKLIIKKKKEILRYYHYYGQLLDVGDTLIEQEEDNKEIFHVFIQRISRLQNETLLLREYTHQLQDLYESQISMHQNDVTKILTIVTTIFLPLTLITGWYGMNFKYMPELSLKYGHLLVIILFIIVVLLCLFIFKKKRFW